MTMPVYQRMRNPITPPKAKPFNRPQIRVKEWRRKADSLETKLQDFSYTMSPDDRRYGYGLLSYTREWIAYAEAILNDGADPAKPFSSTYTGAWKRTGMDPAHIHPVVKPEDFV